MPTLMQSSLQLSSFSKDGLNGQESVDRLVNGVFGIYLILNLIKVSSPASYKYSNEVSTIELHILGV